MSCKWLVVTLSILVSLIVVNVVALFVGVLVAYGTSITSVSLFTTYLARFVAHRRQFSAACWGTTLAMIWAGALCGIWSILSDGNVFVALSGTVVGSLIGLIFGVIPASLFGLIPDSKIHYFGERNPKRDRIIASIVPYISGQGG